MAYASIFSFRKLTNINKDIISDPVLNTIFPVADRLINKLISTPVKLELLDGTINGSNKIFYTHHTPIADITLKNVTLIDSCDATTDWTASTDALAATVVGRLVQGTYSLALGKDGTTQAYFSYTKEFATAVDGTGRRLKIALYIRDILEITAVTIEIGSATNAFYHIMIPRNDLHNGLNEIDLDIVNDMGEGGEVGSPDITALDYIKINFPTVATSDTVAVGNIKMDYWRLEDIDSPDIADVVVYYVTFDANGRKVLGSAQTVTSLLRDEGSITMTTAPTTTTAKGGVYCNYSYVSDNMDWELINPAACYLAAHLASFIISGSAPNYRSIEDGFLRRDLAGAPDEWLRLCYSLLGEAVGDDATGIGFRLGEVDEVTF